MKAMGKKLALIGVLLLFASAAHGVETLVLMERDVSLTRYRAVEVLPVSNDTGKTFEKKLDFDVAATLTEFIRAELRESGYVIVERPSTTGECILVRSSLVAYQPGSAGMRWVGGGAGITQATVRATLIDNRTGEMLGEIVAAGQVTVGGLYTVGANKNILKRLAKGIAKELRARTAST